MAIDWTSLAEGSLARWNGSESDYPREATIHGLFEEQARRNPGAVAVVCGDEELTYGELDLRAERLARRLLALGVGPDESVGLCAERSLDLITALVAILKAGAAYLPLDPVYPRERLAFMLADAAARVVLVQGGLEETLPATGALKVPLRETLMEKGSDAGLPVVDPDNLAYVMFTSGSTGQPKGVAVTHRNVVRLVRETNYADFGPGEVFLQFAPVGFDASTLEIWGPLLNGGKLVLFPPGPPDLERLGAAVERHGVTTLWLTAALFHQMVDSHLEQLRPVRQLLAGGDVLLPGHVRRALAVLPDTTLINGYGPTEGTTFTCCHRMRTEADLGPGPSVPIGTPISNTRVHILDADLEPVAVDETGLLYAGGDGLARGYIGRPDLTAERFVPDPSGGEPGARLYATGDLARWQQSGAIDFLGRADAQVKIRGFRIEPAEVEAALAGHPAVEAAAVVAREDVPGDRRLVACVVPAPGSDLAPAGLRAWLEERLPQPMVPSAFLLIPELPVTANGKVDRRALERLPIPVSMEGAEGRPRTQLEELLAGLFGQVLGLDGVVGVDESFFHLGGHSLLATRLASRVRKVSGVEVGAHHVFAHPTVRQLAFWISQESGSTVPPLIPAAPSGPAPLSNAQQRLWFLERLHPGTPVYNLAQLFDLRGDLSVPALSRALEGVARRHAALRTRFVPAPEGAVQVVSPESRISLPVIDLAALPQPAIEADRLAREEARRPYDLERGPLMRAALLRQGAGEHRLLLGMHHIVSDGWSFDVLMRELSALYAGEALPPLPVQVPDFAIWQRGWLATGLGDTQVAWWRERLAGAPTVLELPSDRPRPAELSYRGERLRLSLGEEAGFAAFSRGQGGTLFMTLLAAWQALLHRWSGQEEMIVGSPVAGRGRLELEGLIGFFVNMLPLRADLSADPGFAQLLAGTRESVLGAFAHQDLPFDHLVEALAPERDPSRTPLVQVAFALQDPPSRPDFGVEVTAAVEVDTGTSRFDLVLFVERGAERLDAIGEYATDLFDRDTVQRMLGAFRALLGDAVARPDVGVSELSLLSPEERAQVVSAGSQAESEVPDRPVHRLFEERAALAPDALAVASAERSLTYGELERQANRLAHRLRRLGVGPEVLAAFLLERSQETVVAALAALKAGGAYLPIDPANPAERTLHILRDAGPRVLISTERILAGLPEVPLPADRIVLLDGEPAPEGSAEPPRIEPEAESLAYVIYTSGSTGAPKGTELRHRGLSNLAAWQRAFYGLGPDDRLSLVAAPGFDAVVLEMWAPLTCGASLHVAPRDVVLSPAAFLGWVAEHRVTVAFLPTPLAESVLAEPVRDGLRLRTLLTGGDRLRRRPGTDLPYALSNLYGPTESTVVATAGWVQSQGHRAPHIGRAVANTRVSILDRGLGPVPAGVPGELCLAGEGLARGYRGRADLTAERFVPDPFGGPGARLYRTGDLARRLPSGDIEFIGRVDHQVKIRGYRIELGEIEAALSRHPDVREAAALVRDGRLLACVVARQGSGQEIDALRAFLAGALPDVMVPTVWAFLDALPVTPNGKVDRRALALVEPAAEARPASVPPRTPMEAAVAEIWASLLGFDGIGGIGGIGAMDDFFALGGHSLLAARAAAAVQERLGVELPLRVVFQHPTVAGLAAWIEAESRASSSGPLLGAGSMAPLSFPQQRLWFLDRLEPGSAAYNVPILLSFSGLLRPELLERSLAEVVRRHHALRTTFEIPAGAADPVQVVQPAGKLSLPVVDLSGLAAGDRKAEAARRIGDEARRPFDLRRGPLLRPVLLRLGADDHRLLAALHHIVFDGWSVEILQRELAALYRAFAAGERSPLPELAIQYPDFAVWQRNHLAGAELERQLAWWRGRLAAAPAVELPADRPRPTVRSDRGAVERAELGERPSLSLEQLGQGQGATPFMTVLAALLALLQRYTGQEDLVVGTAVAGRDRPEVAGLIGFFVNTVALRVDLAGDPLVRELLARVRQTALETYAHQDLPFEQLVAELVPGRDLSRNPLFQVMLALQNLPAEERLAEGLSVRSAGISNAAAKFDLSLAVRIDGGRTAFEAEYSTDLFDAVTLRRFLRHLERVLEGMADHPERRVSELPLLTPAEAQQLLEWNDTAAAFPAGVCLHELVAAQAARTPERPAVVMGGRGGRSLAYRELEEASNRLARRLREAGTEPESVVGVLAERSLEMVVGLLAVLKAGGAYLPLDPDYPAERLAFLLADSRVPVVLAQERLLDRLPAGEARILPLDGSAEASGDGQLLPVSGAFGAGPESLAYVIYTSGSTGRPKGTMVPHRAIVNHMLWMHTELPLAPFDRVLQKTSFSFDASVWELWAPLMAGATLVMALPGEQRDPDALVKSVREHGITVLQAVPSLLHALLEGGRLGECRSLRRVYCGGEALSAGVVAAFFDVQDAELRNLYGPTETAVDVTSWACEREGRRGVVPIGRPLPNTRIHVVDRELRPVPVGVPGELLIGGVQVARGYLARPDLTAERFTPDPFSGEAGARLYRTGDLARLLPDGAVDFLGRIDHQVKLRGLRIELGEIEAALCRLPAVARAVVLVREDTPGNPQIGAFHVPAAEPADADELRAALRRELPDSMIPAWFVALPELPLTPNGKVDRRALAAIAPAAPEDAGVAPRTPMEAAVAEIWSSLLGRREIGAFDDFFALGGHSLLAARLTARVYGRLGVELPLRVVFQETTVARLAVWIESERLRAGAAASSTLVPGLAGATAPLSFAQQRLWFLERLRPGSQAYNIPALLDLSGPLRPELLAAALAEVVRRHSALRTTFEMPEGAAEAVQVIHPAESWSLPVVDLAALPAGDREAEAARLAAEDSGRPFDLTLFPLLRTTLLRLHESRHRLLMTVHHLNSDGWSLELLQRELAALYGAFAAGRPSPLEPLPVQYADYAVWQRGWLAGDELERQLAYWRGQLADPPVLELPADRPRPAVWSYRGAVETASLPAGLGDRLERVARRHGATAFMTQLAVFLVLLHRYTAQEDLLVGMPLAGRGRPEVQGLIGFFVNTLALRVRLDGDPTFAELLTRVRATALEAYDHQDVPFEKLVAELAPGRDLSRNPLFQVMFTLGEDLEPVRIGADLVLTAREGVHHGTAKFDLSLHAGRAGEDLRISAEYGTDLFDAATVRRLLGHVRRLLESVANEEGEGARVSALPLLDKAEREQVLTAWNRTDAEVPEEPVHRLALRWAEVMPDTVAVSWEEGSLTYAGLARRARELALRLRARGVGPEIVVALRLERSADLVAAALGVLEAGGAYLPIDPAHPEERAEWIVRDSGAALLLTAETLAALEREAVPSPAPQRIEGGELPSADSLAYVIYTSGSTGHPKGTELRHRGLSSVIAWHNRAFGIGPGDRMSLVAGPGFDASVWEMWFSLTAGATLHVPPREVVLSPPAFLRWLAEKGVTVSFLPTALAEAALLEPLPAGLSLRILFAGGDRLRRRPAPDLPFTLFNLYGPTECTVMVTAGRVAPAGERTPEIPTIGSPIGNTRVYILDRWLQPVPVGVPGELCLAGEGLARGYGRRPELTAKSFVPDPFGDSQRLYRTGDIARWLPSGEIEYLGRIDHQVKIRGQRIELGEIEVALGRHPSVRDAVVLARDERLVAYVVSREPETPEGLRAWLARSLPEAMLPAVWVFLESLPLTVNGKVDRRALPAPDLSRSEAAAGFIAPRTPLEEEVAQVWREVLGVDRVGVHDSFWALGGHSLLATRLLAQIEGRFQVELPLQTLFASPTLERFSALVGESVLFDGEEEGLDATLAALDDLSEEEVQALIAQTVRELEEMA